MTEEPRWMARCRFFLDDRCRRFADMMACFSARCSWILDIGMLPMWSNASCSKRKKHAKCWRLI